MQADEFNRSNIRTVLALAITSNLSLAAAPGNVRLSARASGLRKPCVINVSQMVTIDQRYLVEKVKTLDKDSMREIDDGLRLVLAL